VLLPESVRVPEPFLVMLPVPEITPEAFMVRPGFTVQVFEAPVKVRLPEMALVPVAFKVKLPEEKFEEIFSAPVRELPRLLFQAVALGLFPEMVRFPVPALALIRTAYSCPDWPFWRFSVIGPLPALVSRVKVRPPSFKAPTKPVMVIADAVMDVSMWLPSAEVDCLNPPEPEVEVVIFTVPLWVILPCNHMLPLDCVAVRFPVPVIPKMVGFVELNTKFALLTIAPEILPVEPVPTWSVPALMVVVPL